MSGCEIAVCSIAGIDRRLEAVADAAVAAGATGLELTARPPHVCEGAGLAELGRAGQMLRSRGLEPVAYGSYLGTGELRGGDDVAREIARCAALGAPRIRVWATPRDPDDDQRSFHEIVELMQQCCEAGESTGVEIVVERHGGSFADTAERAERLLEAVDHERFGLNYQILDFLPLEEASHQAEDARRLAPRARYVHLKNYRLPGRAGERLLPWASLAGGAVDQREVIGGLLRAGYAGVLALEFVSTEESPSFEEKLAADLGFLRRVLRELSSEPGDPASA